jgi:hypothetical protein
MAQASTIRVIEQTHDGILIYQPPYWPFAIGFLIAAAVIAVFFFFFLGMVSVRPPLRFAGFVLALPFLFFGVKAALSQMFVQVSLPDHTLSIRRAGMFGPTVRTIRLDDVVGVVELRARRTTGVGLQLRSGETINLTGFTDQAGKSEMLISLEMSLVNARSRP